MFEALGRKILVVGDDLTTTNPKMIKKVIDEKMVNAVLINLIRLELLVKL